jgi:hypothetical protein
MISLSEKRVSLVNLGHTLEALDKIDGLIKCFSEPKPGPAYLTIRHYHGDPEIQMDRGPFVMALKLQREKLVEYLATLGIDANA